MKRTMAIATREYASYFRLPLGWVVCALFLFLSGLVFARSSIVPGEPANMRDFFAVWWGLLLMIAPAVSMRLLSEELRTGTIEPLMASPLSELSAVGGKFLGAVAFFATCLAPTLLYVMVLAVLSRPDYGPIVAGYVGVLLLGTLYLAVGTLFSALTSSQTLAFLGTLFVLMLAEVGAAQAATMLPEPFNRAALALSVSRRVGDFARGAVDTSHIVFFLAVSAWFVGVAALVLRIRRWR